MILGNSNKGNIGKRYLMRSVISAKSFQAKEVEITKPFNEWFTTNSHALRQQWINKGKYDEDIFIDTYIRICESIAFGNASIKDYQAYFSRAYYTNYILNSKFENRFQYVDISSINRIDEVDITLFETEYKEVVFKMFSKAKEILSSEEYKIFKGYLLWKENQQGKRGGSYKDYSKIINESPHNIQTVVSKAKKMLLEDKDLNEKVNKLYSLI